MSRFVRTVLALVLTVLVAGTALPAPAGAATARTLSPLRCTYFANGDTAHNYELCVQVLRRLARKDKLVYGTFVQNGLSRQASGSCTSRSTKTFRWGGSISGTVEGKAWIFAKVAATVTASFDKTRTAEYSVSANFPVPAHSTVYCYYVERHEQYRTRQCISNAYTDGRQCSRRVFFAPSGRAGSSATTPWPTETRSRTSSPQPIRSMTSGAGSYAVPGAATS